MEKLKPLTSEQKGARVGGGFLICLVGGSTGQAIGGVVGGAIILISILTGLALIGNALFAPRATG